MKASIPTGPGDLTPEWVTGALQASGAIGDATVRDVRTELVGQGLGVLCQLFRVSLAYEGTPPPGAPASVIAKLPSPEEQTRGMASAFRFYEREVRFYAELRPEISLSTPHAYTHRFDATTGDFVLLLEDLADRRLGDQLLGATPDEARILTTELARHHAEWWNNPRLPSFDWVPESSSELNKAGLSMYPAAIGPYLERFGAELPAALPALIERLAGEINPILDRMSAPGKATTLCHGDWRLDNFFFASRPGQPSLTAIDWQIAVRSVGPYDLGYFTSQSLDVDVRRSVERDLLRLYFEELKANGIADYDYDEFIEDYRWVILFCLVYPVMAGAFGDLGNERGVALARAMGKRCTEAIADWDAASLIS